MAFTRKLADFQTRATARMLLAVAASMAMLGDNAHAKKGIIGKDDRTLVPAKYEYLARGVGIIHDRAKNLLCTAFCVGPDMIVTNAHCLAHRLNSNSLIEPRDIRDFAYKHMIDGVATRVETLKFNRFGGDGKPQLSVIAGRRPRGSGRISGQAWRNSKFEDWAVARLAGRLCAADVLRFADPRLLNDTAALKRLPTFMIGFHLDTWKKDRFERYSPCKITNILSRRKRRLAYHNCDAQPIASGSPIFASTPEGPRIVAIHSSRRMIPRRTSNRRGTRAAANLVYMAVLPLEFLPMLPRFESARFLNGVYSIEQLQTALKAAGHHRGAVDGQFGPQTQASIKRFERALGLVPLGIPTVEIVDKLRALP